MFKDNRFKDLTMGDLRKDLIAGITVGVVAIPLGMAFAIASGVKPEYGLYTTIIAGLLVALFGGSRFQIAGPTGAFIPILLAIVLQYGYEDLLIAGLLAGIMLVIMGIFKVGNSIKFIPRSVTIGFTSGIAIIIFSGQFENFLGLDGIEKKEYFHENMLQIIRNISTINIYSILVALLGLLIIIFLPKVFPHVPVLLVALIIPTILAILMFPGKVATIGSEFGGISQSFPEFTMPKISMDKIVYLWQPAFVIAMLGGIESLLSAVVSDGMTGKKHDSNRELIGQGIANIVTPLFGGIPATGAIARTATNIRAGGVSPFSGIFQSVFVLLTLLLIAPYASHVPLASMAPILMVVAFNMSEYKSFWHILKLKSGDSLVLVTTFLLTVFVNLTIAVPIGLALAMISFIKRMSEVLKVQKILPNTSFLDLEDGNEDYRCPQIASFTIHGPLFFGAADKFETIITQSINERPSVLILKMRHVSIIDVTGEANLSSLILDFQRMGGTVLISEIEDNPFEMLEMSGLSVVIGQEHFFKTTTEAINYALTLINPENCPVCAKNGYDKCQTFIQLEEKS
ncbi:SulP family inorganic anion transporter [Paraliobacillus sp. JSM ZJ581]|uniref:SulP family inorganic anion transporter n=1 Tax=Paraliobacillus sp. JSM ZJ581 TaxID=3342118 RepID=UPI0035A85174